MIYCSICHEFNFLRLSSICRDTCGPPYSMPLNSHDLCVSRLSYASFLTLSRITPIISCISLERDLCWLILTVKRNMASVKDPSYKKIDVVWQHISWSRTLMLGTNMFFPWLERIKLFLDPKGTLFSILAIKSESLSTGTFLHDGGLFSVSSCIENGGFGANF